MLIQRTTNLKPMKETTWGIMRRRVASRLVVIALASSGFALPGQAATNTLTSGNSVVQINPNSQQGMFNWTVGGANQLAQQWFWLGVGSGAPASIDTISAATLSGVTANTLTTTYGNASYNLGITYTLTGGINGGGPGLYKATWRSQSSSTTPRLPRLPFNSTSTPILPCRGLAIPTMCH